MTTGRRAIVLAAASVLIVVRAAGAHRLDEYLQATRIEVGAERVALDISLTPGANVSELVLSQIDVDGNGEVTPREADAYASRLGTDLRLSLDGRLVPLTVAPRSCPESGALRAGTGVIRLRAGAAALSRPGRHHLAFTNGHMGDISVYLVNALIPTSDAVRVTAQGRDSRQRAFTLDYEVRDTSAPLTWSIAAGVLVLGLVASRKPGAFLRGRRKQRP